MHDEYEINDKPVRKRSTGLSEEDKQDIAKLVVSEILNQLRVGVGKGILDGIWKWFITILLAGALYIYAAGHYKMN